MEIKRKYETRFDEFNHEICTTSCPERIDVFISSIKCQVCKRFVKDDTENSEVICRDKTV